MTVQNVPPAPLLLASDGAQYGTRICSRAVWSQICLRCTYRLAPCGKYCVFAGPPGEAPYNLPHIKMSCGSPGSSVERFPVDLLLPKTASCFPLKSDALSDAPPPSFGRESKAEACSKGVGFQKYGPAPSWLGV